MKHFHDISEKKDTLEINSPIGYQDIKADDKFTKEQAVDYWDSVFADATGKHDENSFDEENLISEIFDRSEDDFEIDFEIDEDIQVVLEKFNPDNWERLTDSEWEAVVGELATVIGDKLGLDETPKLRFFEDSKNKCGAFNANENTIEINKNNFTDPKGIIDTTAHEVRHAYQHQCALRNETYTDKLYKVNFDNYISPVQLPDGKYLFFTDYQDQYVEAESRAFANLFREETS